MRLLITFVCLCLSFCFTAYASDGVVASPANASSNTELVNDDPLSYEELVKIRSLLEERLDEPEKEPLQVIDEIEPIELEVLADENSFPFSSGCVIYRISYGSSINYAVFPLSAADSLSVTDDSYLVNTSTSTVSGRIFGNSADINADNGYTITLQPYLTSNVFSTIRNNGHAGYITHYYWEYSNSRYHLTSTSSYYDFKVLDYQVLPSGASYEGHTYKALLLLILLTGGVMVCLFRHSWI